ncbi:MAG: polyphosphate kinase 1, partial [Fluviibacter sp.]
MTPTAHNAPPSHFLNRELGLIAFNRRVLAQAQDERVPLLERLFFLCIVSSNLDEFFEIRMAGLKEQIKGHSKTPTTDGLLPQEAYDEVSSAVHRLVADQYRELNETLLPAAANEGVRFLRRSQWTDAQREWIRDYFFREVMPVLTPIGLDPSHPFPRIYNKSLNFIVELEGRDAFGRSSGIAIVQAPRVLPRIIRLPESLAPEAAYCFIFLSSIVHAFVGELFSGMTVQGCYQFRVTRNSDLFVDEEEVKNLRAKIQGELPQRNFGDAVRLEVADNTSPAMTEFLLTQFGLEEKDLYRVEGPVNLVRLMQVPGWVDRPDLKFPTFVPGEVKRLEKGKNIFNVIRKGDALLYHPYQRFTPVIQLLESAATDPQVVAIKMTVYRTGTDSVLMNSLIRAAQNGKEVT